MHPSEAPPTPIPIFKINTIAVAINNAIEDHDYDTKSQARKNYLLKTNHWSTLTYEKVDWGTLDQCT